jgi:hypothetical protein
MGTILKNLELLFLELLVPTYGNLGFPNLTAVGQH